MVFKKIPNHSKLISIVSFAQLEQFLKSQPKIKSAEKIAGNDFFNETWKIMVRQPLNHSDTTKGFFLQRVFVAEKGSENAVLLITEGYSANYAASPRYLNELTPMLQSNQITVEHSSYPKLKMPRFRSIFAISVYSFFKRYQEQYKAPDNYG